MTARATGERIEIARTEIFQGAKMPGLAKSAPGRHRPTRIACLMPPPCQSVGREVHRALPIMRRIDAGYHLGADQGAASTIAGRTGEGSEPFGC
jgi:hypothetical protein